MGLATSQVRLLALTSRKADVEMQIQLNSKRKTMLTREATELSKLYYAKLQNSKIMYSTTNGNKPVTYEYLMANDKSGFFKDVVNKTSYSGYDRKTSDQMILTDSYGRVILSESMKKIFIAAYDKGDNGIGGKNNNVESMTLDAMQELLSSLVNGNSPSGDSGTADSIYKIYSELYSGKAFNNSPTDADKQLGYDVLKSLYRNGYQTGGTIYQVSAGKYCSDPKNPETSIITPTNGTFYIIKDLNYKPVYNTNGAGAQGVYFCNDRPIETLNATIGSQLCNMFSYYGAIFSAAFSGTKTTSAGILPHFNISADIVEASGGKYTIGGKSYNMEDRALTNAQDNQVLQDGLKSGLYQLVNVNNLITGGYAKAQGLNYFKTQNYVVEQTDNGERETITAWYNAARADLNSKESYWDTEITTLSTELNSITTEIDSVKKLREDAISSTFKWGNG